ncbi:uncharacterized protein si:dkey-191c17.2 [Heterodontus francisci]|uniref:uncharacterized protein si:dkey-191c17.2 n=1 Tax=Heterodontus francisci TaxID=7792 RepID=UPI00355C94B3
MQRLRIKQSYWLDEQTEAKLRELGAVLVDEVIVKDHYYDNDTFDLAMNQIWLSQRDLQWQLIIGLPKTDNTIDANEDEEKQREEAKQLASKSQMKGKDRRQCVGSLISSEYDESSPRLKPQNNKAQISRQQDNEKEGENTVQEHQTPISPQQQDTTTSNSETGAHAKTEPRYGYNELKAHRQIIEYIAQFLKISLAEEESNMKITHFCQLAEIHHYASCHTARRRTYKLQDIYSIVINRDELASRNLAVIYVDANGSNIIKELEKIEAIAAHLGFDPCQTNQILA